jgi:peptidyl-prolyl cis-trans isomerase D
MLEYMRKNANSTVVWLIIGAIAVVFIFFGIGGGGGQTPKITVNGEEVSLQEYDRMIQEVSRAVRDRGGENPAGVDRMVRTAAVSRLVNQVLTRQFARAVGLMPSDRAVAREIAAIPEFQVDGRFDVSRYRDALAAGRMSAAGFEDEKRDELLAGRVVDLVSGLARVYRPEMLEIFHFQEDRIRLDYAFFPAAGLRHDVVVDDAVLTAFYALNQEQWREPAQMTMEYVDIRPADFLAKATVDEADLRRAYDEDPQRFARPESAEVSHILFQFPRLNPTPEEKEATRARAEAARRRAASENFAALARELSEDPNSAPLGGALGAVGRGMTFEDFERAVFSLPLNEVSQPVETVIGYHLIKVTGRRAAGARSFEEVKATLADERKALQSREMAVAQLEELIIRAETSKLPDAAASLGLKAETTPMFTRAAPPKFLEEDQAAVKKVFEAPVGRVADPLELKEHLLLYVPVERRESRIPDLAQVRNQAAEAWIAEEALRLAQAEAGNFIQEARGLGWAPALAALPKAERIKSGAGELSTRAGLAATRLFQSVSFPELLAAAHSVAGVGEISPVTVPGELGGEPGAFALFLAEARPADESRLTGSEGEALAGRLNGNEGNLMLRAWNLGLFEASRDAILVPTEYME